MNKNVFILTVFATFLLFIGCSDDPFTSLDQSTEGSKELTVRSIVADIVLTPSGDLFGVTDANALEAALNAVPAGGVVLLESGAFYLNREIYVPNFQGTLTGAGINETELIGVGDAGTPFAQGTFLVFDQPSGDLIVKNLSMTLPDDFVCDFGNFNLLAFMVVNLSSDGSNTHFDNLRLTGTDAIPGSAPIFVHQPINGISVTGESSNFPIPTSGGHHTLTNSEFSKIAFQASQHQLLKEATIEISKNNYSDLKQFICRWLDGSNVTITRNTMETFSFGAIVVTQEDELVPGVQNAVVISHNNVSTAGFMPIEIGFIPDGGAGFDLLIEKNKLTNLGPDPLGFFPHLTGIGICYGNNGAVVRNNKISGEAEFGILAETNESTFIGNNLNGFDPIVADYGIFGDGNTVVGTGKSTVIDGGVDNIITGLTKVPGVSIGDRIKEAQAKRKAILEANNQYN